MKTLRGSLILIMMLVMLSISLHAQESYTLITPTAEDYLRTIAEIVNLPYEEGGRHYLYDVMDQEFRLFYWDSADYQTLYQAFNLLNGQVYSYDTTYTLPTIDFDLWVEKLLQTWFAENNPTWQWYQTLTFDDFTLTHTAYDFDRDGTLEWLMTVQHGAEFASYMNYMIAKDIDNRIIIYALDIEGFVGGSPENSFKSYPLAQVTVQNVTGDETLQLLVSDRAYFHRFEFSNTFAVLMIIGWNGEAPVVYAAIDTPLPVKLTNEDEDVALEVLVTTPNTDNWGCGTIITTLYDWDSSLSKYVEKVTNTPTDCTARQAEEAMWRGDFAEAARLYEQYIARVVPLRAEYDAAMKKCDCYDFGRDLQILEYFELRRIIVYALLNDMDKVTQYLADYNEKYPNSIFKNVAVTPQALCQAAYDEFVYWLPQYYEPLVFPGVVDDAPSDWQFVHLYASDPIRAGCDIGIFSVEPTPLPTLTSTPDPTSTPDLRTHVERAVDTGNIVTAFYRDDYQAVLTIFDEYYETLNPEETFERQQWQYYHALSLELLNRPDEALAAYVALYESAPDSAWGKLAKLHFQ